MAELLYAQRSFNNSWLLWDHADIPSGIITDIAITTPIPQPVYIGKMTADGNTLSIVLKQQGEVIAILRTEDTGEVVSFESSMPHVFASAVVGYIPSDLQFINTSDDSPDVIINPALVTFFDYEEIQKSLQEPVIHISPGDPIPFNSSLEVRPGPGISARLVPSIYIPGIDVTVNWLDLTGGKYVTSVSTGDNDNSLKRLNIEPGQRAAIKVRLQSAGGDTTIRVSASAGFADFDLQTDSGDIVGVSSPVSDAESEISGNFAPGNYLVTLYNNGDTAWDLNLISISSAWGDWDLSTSISITDDWDLQISLINPTIFNSDVPSISGKVEPSSPYIYKINGIVPSPLSVNPGIRIKIRYNDNPVEVKFKNGVIVFDVPGLDSCDYEHVIDQYIYPAGSERRALDIVYEKNEDNSYTRNTFELTKENTFGYYGNGPLCAADGVYDAWSLTGCIPWAGAKNVKNEDIQ